MQRKISCEQAKQIDLVEYLASLGYHPKKIRNHDYWYLSPFRKENTPSFKIHKSKNLWFDFGEGKGGDIIDFGTKYHNCSVSELLEKLSQNPPTKNLSFHPPITAAKQFPGSRLAAGEKKETGDGKILIIDRRNLASKPLLEYLEKRKIPVEIAEQFCREIDFLLYNKKYTAIGFQNSAGGYELRSQNLKGSSSPKAITFFDYQQQQLVVFEGFFSFLSFQAIQQKQSRLITDLPELQSNFLVLNSLSFFEKSRDKMEAHRQIHLYLDRDKAGIKAIEKALQWSQKYIDQSHRYKSFKDLNEYLIKSQGLQHKTGLRHGRPF